jgi:hypothetical protein
LKKEGVCRSRLLGIADAAKLGGKFVESQVARLNLIDERTHGGAEVGATFGETLEVGQGRSVVMLL